MTGAAARVAVRQMRQLSQRPRLGSALTAGAVTDSLAFAIADWTGKLPPAMLDETDRGTATVLGDIPPSEMVRDAWEDWNTDRKRAAVKAVVNAVTVHPTEARSGGPNWTREHMLSYITSRTVFDWRF